MNTRTVLGPVHPAWPAFLPGSARIATKPVFRSFFRSCARAVAIASLMAGTGASHAADSYPSKPGRLILPFGVGGSTDIVGRIFAQHFSEAWGQPLVVDNRPGAGGVLGSTLAAKATPDGYTILTYGVSQPISLHLYQKLQYDPLRDFMPVSLYATLPNILCVNPSLPAANVGEFVRVIKAKPGQYKYASSGIGASPHLTMEWFKHATGIDLVHVPYKVSSQAYVETMTGQVQAFFFNLTGPLPHVRAGRLRALAVTSAKRAEQVPDVPTLMESGVPDFEVTVWQGYALPKGASKAHLAKIHAAMMKALGSPELKKRFYDNGVAASPQSPQEFAEYIERENAKWKNAIALAGVRQQ